MKKKIALLTVFCVAISAIFSLSGFKANETMAATTFQRVNFVNATVTATSLNVREGASTNHKVVCVLKQGQTVKVFGKLGDWYAIYEPSTGCVGAVYSKYLKSAGSTSKQSQAKTPSPTATSTPQKTTTPTPTTTPAPTASPSPTTQTPIEGVSQEEQDMLALINKARADAGLEPLSFDTELQKVARLKAKDMVDKNYFSHQSPTYGSPFDMMRQFNISFKTAGENIAGNQTVQGAFNAWMNSPGHKANILNGKFNYTGIGIVNGSQYGKIFVQMFIGR